MQTPDMIAHERARRRQLAESRIEFDVLANLAGAARAAPVGDRLAAQHFHLCSTVSPLAIGMAWLWREQSAAADRQSAVGSRAVLS